jgi:REP element-mobilizing transposase RayT
MKRSRRKCLPGMINHCYLRTVDGSLLFYSVTDCLVYFTVFCAEAGRYGVRILALCLMPDHIHMSIVADSKESLSEFVGAVSRAFSRQQNRRCHRVVSLFERSFGSVPKAGAKKARANLLYVGNNPVERQLCQRAEQYQWNFLAYARSAHPFSEELVLRRARWPLLRAIREVRAMHKQGKHLTYTVLERIARPLEKEEKKQLADFIVSLYSIIDHATASRFFDGYDQMLTAMHADTGSEHDLNEIFTGKNDTCYTRMSNWLLKNMELKDIHDLFLLPEAERVALMPDLLRETEATAEQVAKYLRIKLLRADFKNACKME